MSGDGGSSKQRAMDIGRIAEFKWYTAVITAVMITTV